MGEVFISQPSDLTNPPPCLPYPTPAARPTALRARGAPIGSLAGDLLDGPEVLAVMLGPRDGHSPPMAAWPLDPDIAEDHGLRDAT